MIAAKDLTFSYSPGADARSFSFPDFRCSNNETLLILGQSGRGKTTLLHLLALLLRPASGEILIDNTAIRELSPRQAAGVRAQKIGIVYQKAHFVGALSVMDNLLLANYLSDRPQDRERAVFLAGELGFAGHLHKKTHQLSQGEQQRVSIARALMNNPTVILADEPTSSLDDLNCDRVIHLLQEQSQKLGASLVVVTHDQRLKSRFPNSISL